MPDPARRLRAAASRFGRGLARVFGAEGGLPLVFIALTCVALYPVWRPRLLPLLNLPNHLALARGWHDYHDPASRVAEFYHLRIKVEPYILFYGTIDLLLYLVPIEAAAKLFLSAYVVLFPLAVLMLALALRRSPWLAVFAFPLIFNQNWIYGFASYLMSVTLALFAWAALLRYLDTRRAGYAIALGVACELSYLGHIMPWALFGLCAILTLVLELLRGGLRAAWERCLIASLVMLPSLAMAIAVILDERGEHTYIKDAPFAGTFRDFPTSVIEFPRRVMELFPGTADQRVLLVLVLVLGALLLWDRIERAGAPRDASGRLLVVCLWALGLAYISLPYGITKPMSWWYVAPRIPSLMMVLLALLPAVRITGLRRLIFAPVIVCAVVLPLTLAKLYRAFSGRNMPMLRLIEELPRGAPTLLVVRNMMRGSGSEEKSGDPASSGPVYWHFSSWPMALKDGYSPYAFDQGIPLCPAHRLKAPGWGSTDTFEFRQAPEFQYYIVRDPTERMDHEPSVKPMLRIGEWALYKRIAKITEEP